MSFSSLEPVRHRTKVQALSAQIIGIAREMGPDTKLPTIVRLCEMLGVSMTTLNSALADLEGQKVIYRRHGVGIFVSPYLSQKSVGLVCAPEFFRAGTSPFWQQIIEDVQVRAASKNETFRFYLAIPSGKAAMPVNQDLRDDVNSKRLHGVFFIGNDASAVQWLQSAGVPVVVFAGEGDWNVGLDYSEMVRRAVDVLIENGCTRLALLSPGETQGRAAASAKEAETGHKTRSETVIEFERRLGECALEVRPEWVWDVSDPLVPFAETHQEQGFAGAMHFFGARQSASRREIPDGVVIVDDMMTRGALVAMQKMGLKPGADVQIASHLNKGSAVLHGYEGDLHLIEIDPAAVVGAMFETLEILMAGQTPDVAVRWVAPRLKGN